MTNKIELMKVFSNDVLRLLITFLESPIDKVRLSRCNKKFYEKLKDFIKVEKWNEYSPNKGMKKATAIECKILIDFFISKGADDWNAGVSTAAREGNKSLVDFFMCKGADVNWGFLGAIDGGHQSLIDFFISKGANDWNLALYRAGKGGQRDLVDFFVSKGAYMWDWALAGAAKGGHQEMIDFFISKGANDWHWAMFSATGQEIVDFFNEKIKKDLQ